MARRPSRGAGNNDTEKPRALSPHDAAIDAFMALLASQRFGEIRLDAVAEGAGLSLSGLRAAFSGKMAILKGFSERIDLAVLAAGPAEGENERDRLFDVLMRRLDAMEPHRSALRNLARSARSDPLLACALGLISDRSMTWMLAAAGIRHGGFVGRLAKSGSGMVFAEAMRTWLDEDDASHEKTMAALDRALRRGERVMGAIREGCDFIASLGRRGRSATASG